MLNRIFCIWQSKYGSYAKLTHCFGKSIASSLQAATAKW